MLARLQRLRKLKYNIDRIWLEKVLVVEVIEQDVETFLGVGHLCFVARGCAALDTEHFVAEDLVDWLCVGWDVAAVSGGCGRLLVLMGRHLEEITYDIWVLPSFETGQC